MIERSEQYLLLRVPVTKKKHSLCGYMRVCLYVCGRDSNQTIEQIVTKFFTRHVLRCKVSVEFIDG